MGGVHTPVALASPAYPLASSGRARVVQQVEKESEPLPQQVVFHLQEGRLHIFASSPSACAPTPATVVTVRSPGSAGARRLTFGSRPRAGSPPLQGKPEEEEACTHRCIGELHTAVVELVSWDFREGWLPTPPPLVLCSCLRRNAGGNT